MSGDSTGSETKNEPGYDQQSAKVPVAISEDRSTEPAQQNSSEASKKTRPPRHDRFDWVNLVVLLLTFVAAAAAAAEAGRLADLTEQLVRDGQDTGRQQAELTRAANELNRRALVASSRAWVGPTDAKIDGGVVTGKPVKIVVSVRNSGREPAKGFTWTAEPITMTGESLMLSADMEDYIRKCFDTASNLHAQVLYPSEGFGSGFDFSMTLPGDQIDDLVTTGGKTLIARGCITYSTFGESKHSAFCYFYKGGFTPTDHLNICVGGSNAE
jgi:hypothetical protein